MKKTMINQTHIEGVLYEHNLEAKVSGEASKNPGTPFIAGTISIATDDAMTNIVPIHFSYVTATFGSGKPNDTYTTLSNIVNGTAKNIRIADRVGTHQNLSKLFKRIDFLNIDFIIFTSQLIYKYLF